MPHKHTVKIFVKKGHYHVYNRGVEKRNIFMDKQDYTVFLKLLKHYLSPAEKNDQHPLITANTTLIRPRPLPTLEKEVRLMTYCLMPNHFHLLIKQISVDGMSKLLRRISTTYSMYFNRRYKRVGHLFQGIYKAALITKDAHLLHLSRYIHLNPSQLTSLPAGKARFNLVNYPYSSYSYYLGKKKASWIKPKFILSYFDQTRNLPNYRKFLSYQEFVEINDEDPQNPISQISID